MRLSANVHQLLADITPLIGLVLAADPAAR
jgi:hypothetical protein